MKPTDRIKAKSGEIRATVRQDIESIELLFGDNGLEIRTKDYCCPDRYASRYKFESGKLLNDVEKRELRRRINTDVEKMVKTMMEETSPGFAEMVRWHTPTLEAVLKRLSLEGK